MSKKILVISGSPKRNGNTSALIEWFAKGARSKGARVEVIHAASLKLKAPGCTACRVCQGIKKFECVIKDGASEVIGKMSGADVIVFATPLYFYSASAQLKVIIDRMFALFKWDNAVDTFQTPLKGKTLVLIASAYENIGLKALEKPFALTADYTGMKFASLLVPNAGESGGIRKLGKAREKMVRFGKKVAS